MIWFLNGGRTYCGGVSTNISFDGAMVRASPANHLYTLIASMCAVLLELLKLL